jgi:hypothetical protein
MKPVLFIFLLLPVISFSQSLFTVLPPQKTGVSFQNRIVESSTDNVLAYEYFYNGGGVATGDLNNDGMPDIVFTANMDQPKVYLNKGGFVFDDISSKSKIRATGWKTGVTMADVNADGWLDVYIMRSGNGDEDSRSNLLFINQKNGTFREVAAEFGLDDKGYSTHAAFFDFDRDGDLDCYVLNHPIKRYTRFDVAYMKAARDPFAGDKIYRNDKGHFTDITLQSGITGNPISFGLGIAISDFNQDGWPDMYISNDYDEDDYLYINQKNGTFIDECAKYFSHTSKFSMGSDVGDVNNDGLPDLMTLDMLPEDNRRQKLLKGPDGYDHFQMLLRNGYGHQYMRNMLHVSGTDGNTVNYSEVGQLAGVSNTDWSWSALFADYDLDGWQDLFITNGYMRDYTSLDFLKYDAPEEIRKARQAGKEPDLFEVVKKMPASNVKNYFFRNNGNLQFQNANTNWGFDAVSLSNGAAYADFDNDGDWDLVVNNINQPAFILQNNANLKGGNFLKIKFKGNAANPFGSGARVVVSSADGWKQVQELQPSRGFQSSVEPALIFGLGVHTQVDVHVTWPDGKQQKINNVPPGKNLILDYVNSIDGEDNIAKTGILFTKLKDSLHFRHIENDYNDFKREPLLPHQFSRNGPALAKADVNGDGLPDFFIGGANGQPGVLFIQNSQKEFTEKKTNAFYEHRFFEDVDCFFADLDNDKDQDLYVVSGGNEANFADRVYWNDGKGNFVWYPGRIPETNSSGGQAIAFDIDQDGDLDIFRSGQVKTGGYPGSPTSYLLLNDKGVFQDITPEWLKNAGMISTVKAADMNNDGVPDLVYAGEFLSVSIASGQKAAPYFSPDKVKTIPNSSGWWNELTIVDIDQDGDPDIVAGNHGLNSQMKATEKEPVMIDAFDIDNNKNIDAIISYFIKGKSYPLPTRDELFEQVPSLKTKFPDYKSYADATVNEIFGSDQLAKALHLEAKEFRSGVFLNKNGEFNFLPFDHNVQSFPVRAILAEDINKDGRIDLLLAGNNYAVRAQAGKYDAGHGVLLIQEPSGNFKLKNATGFNANKDVRKMIQIENVIIVANNNDQIDLFRIN